MDHQALIRLRTLRLRARAARQSEELRTCSSNPSFQSFQRGYQRANHPICINAGWVRTNSRAHTSALGRRDSAMYEQMINGGRTAFLSAGIEGMLEGGVQILQDGQCVGAIGVSGVKPAEDAQIARTGATALAG